VRIDSGVVSGDEVSIYYDPMIAKLVVWSENRDQALALLIQSLKQYMICGVTTNIPYLIKVANSEPFRKAILTTDFIERHADTIAAIDETAHNCAQGLTPTQIIAITAMLSAKNTKTAGEQSSIVDYAGFRLNHKLMQAVTFTHNNNYHCYQQHHTDTSSWTVVINEQNYAYNASKTNSLLTINTTDFIATYSIYENDDFAWILDNTGLLKVSKYKVDMGSLGEQQHAGDILAPMNGTMVAMRVEKGQQVEKDDLLVVVEAMKMEHSMRAPFAGTVEECFGKAGDLVNDGQILVSLVAPDKDNAKPDLT
jgi:3-methylcrotonyl-CoA carboxylase alpha subunit